MTPHDLNWLQSHPYVKEWRSQESNSYLETVKSLNTKLNVSVDHPITVARVHNIVGPYIELLIKKVKNSCKKRRLPKNSKIVAEEFNLTRTEAELIVNRL